ncbi:DUF1272 domain-containing protein [Streptomyces sp. NPDC004546]|uniref:DUF1272 domain-containing protein n=1 Tax=unclassified Streptomyces TaxID=2593676 RepID=UPI0033AB4AEC
MWPDHIDACPTGRFPLRPPSTEWGPDHHRPAPRRRRTFCEACGEALGQICPNCGGELVARPRRPAAAA